MEKNYIEANSRKANFIIISSSFHEMVDIVDILSGFKSQVTSAGVSDFSVQVQVCWPFRGIAFLKHPPFEVTFKVVFFSNFWYRDIFDHFNGHFMKHSPQQKSLLQGVFQILVSECLSE